MYLFPSTITSILAFSTLVFAIEGSLSQRVICIAKGEVCHKTGEACCDGFKCALAHGGKADVGYCTESGLLLQDYYQAGLP
ncbi:uncharacterized protein EAF01_009039 [Botrytis porri]|uniref:Uncharacterized protein n=1 Tax=Botrytis porri TaxID=87229 RepID=A0A4Z1KGN4_9HELO|nr:uncharacterized protein EAF01_009039 [Botrytis porri]KAF7896636.1 hypothetical protein EAF01_009039 [Botrytis porri]TGO84526.1 hypothetical protein BPOR_0494g00020 [Botrytis porri]